MYERQIRKTSATVMRHYVEIQAVTRTNDGEGGVTVSWSTSATVAASVDPIKAIQQFNYKSVNVDATHLIKIRGEITINEKNRILWGSRIFEILTIEDINENGILKVITTKEAR
jgi:SPP1 family predicted phage head-tail adaptor